MALLGGPVFTQAMHSITLGICMGLLMGLLARRNSALASAFVGTGFLGGFTTFSSFALDTVQLWREGHMAFALLNVGLNAVLCIGLAGLGWSITAPRRESV